MTLTADETLLVQVVAGLVHNAAQCTPADGEIAIAAAVEGDMVVLRVRDSGIGMEPSKLARVFDLFAEPGASHGGLGVGLPLARHIVELHGGTIAATSAGPGRGSELVVRLPLADATLTVSSTTAPAAGAARGAPDARVLIVDDNADVRASVADLLGSLGYDVRTAGDGETALAVADRWRPTHALIDLNMPLANGFDVARRLRARFAPEEVKLILMSGVALNDVLRESARRAGFDEFVDKVADPEEWAAVLRQDDGP